MQWETLQFWWFCACEKTYLFPILKKLYLVYEWATSSAKYFLEFKPQLCPDWNPAKTNKFFPICEMKFGLTLLYQVMQNSNFLPIFVIHHLFIFSYKMWITMYHSNLSRTGLVMPRLCYYRHKDMSTFMSEILASYDPIRFRMTINYQPHCF